MGFLERTHGRRRVSGQPPHADAWTRFLAKARRFEHRLARHDWKLADDFVALFAEYSRVLLIAMDEARREARRAASLPASGS